MLTDSITQALVHLFSKFLTSPKNKMTEQKFLLPVIVSGHHPKTILALHVCKTTLDKYLRTLHTRNNCHQFKQS